MNNDENTKIVLDIIKDVLYLDANITDSLEDDLSCDEIDRIEIVMALEERFNFIVSSTSDVEFSWKTVKDIIDFVNSELL